MKVRFAPWTSHCGTFSTTGASTPCEGACPTASAPEILSGTEEGDHVLIVCNGYELRLRYTDLHVVLDNGTPITVSDLTAVAERYWEAWEKRGPRTRVRGRD